MQEITVKKVKGLVNIANKGGFLIIGADNLKKYHKKLYLIIRSKTSGKNLEKISQRLQSETSCEILEIDDDKIEDVLSIKNCKVAGIKNKGLCDEILKIIRGENIG